MTSTRAVSGGPGTSAEETISTSASGRPPRVLVVDDHAVLAQALALVLQQEQIDVLVASDLSDQGILATAEEYRPDVALLDLYLERERTSLPLIGPLTERGVRVLMLTASERPAEMAACLEAGAVAVLAKSEALGASVDALRSAVAGESVRAREGQELRAAGRAANASQAALLEPFERLTPRERETLAAMVEGKRASEIASEHGISLNTVRSHLESIRTKVGVSSQLAVVAMAREAGWTNSR